MEDIEERQKEEKTKLKMSKRTAIKLAWLNFLP